MANVGGSVTVVGLKKILDKLDEKKLVRPAQTFQEASAEGKAYLAGKLSETFPVTSSQVIAESNDARGVISAPSHPYIFFERGSQYPSATRSHGRRKGVKTGALRIKPRRYLSQTRSLLRRRLPELIKKLAEQTEQDWAR